MSDQRAHPRSLVRQLSSDTLLFGLGTVLPSALSFILVPLYTRTMVPAELGLLNFVQSIVAVLILLATAGLDSGVALIVAEDRPSRRSVVTATLLTLLGTALLVSCMALGLGLLVAPSLFTELSPELWRGALLFGVALVPIRALSGFCMGILKWRRRSALYATLAVGTNVVVVAVVSTVLLSPAVDAVRVLGAFVLAYSVASIAVLFMTARTECSLPPAWRALPPVFILGLPFLISGLFEMLLPVLNRGVVAHVLGMSAVGVLAAGWSLSYVVTVCTTAFSLAYQPLALFAAARSNDQESIPLIARWYGTALFFVVVTAATFSRPMVHLVLGGGDYRQAFLVLPAFLGAVWLSGVRVTYEMGLVAARRTSMFISAYALSCLIGVVAAWVGCQFFGVVGAAWAVTLAELVLALKIYRSVQQVRPLAFAGAVNVRLFGLYLFLALTLYLADSNFTRAGAWVLVVILAYFWSGGVSSSERRSIRGRVARGAK